MTATRILIAGIGNIFLGDDAFGVEVARRIADRPLPDGVLVADFGIRGLDLAHALLDGPEAAILVDATPRGGVPGTLYVLDPGGSGASPTPDDLAVDMHGMDPSKVLRLVSALGGRVGRLLIVGCEPLAVGDDQEMMLGMSPPVLSAVDEAVALVESLVATILDGNE